MVHPPLHKEAFPLFSGQWVHRDDDPHVFPLYCASMLMLLQPWFDLGDIKGGFEHFPDAFHDFERTARKEVLTMMESLQVYYECTKDI